MKYNRLDNKYIIRIDRGEEIIKTLRTFCKEKNIKLGSITGIGATNKATIGLYDVEAKKYLSTELTGYYEIAPLHGNISTKDGEPYLHIHINLCDENHKSYGGHLDSAVVSATFEGIIDVIQGMVERKFDKKTGLNLLKL
jgi:hypothetical protein